MALVMAMAVKWVVKTRIFRFFKYLKNLKRSKFRFLGFVEKHFKIQILDSQSQQKSVAFQPN